MLKFPRCSAIEDSKTLSMQWLRFPASKTRVLWQRKDGEAKDLGVSVVYRAGHRSTFIAARVDDGTLHDHHALQALT